VPTVRLPALFRERCGGATAVTVEGSTLGEVLLALDRRCPGIFELLVEGGSIRPELAVAIDGETGSYLLDEPVPPGAEIAILPAIAGG
jgi:molybdopterin synthase sulfur carrier subunit